MYVRENNKNSLGDLLDDFPLDEAYLYDVNNWISHQLLQELYRRMVRILNDPNAVYRMAMSSGKFQSLGILDRIARLIGSPRNTYSQAPRYNKLLKLNGQVITRQIDETSILIEDRYLDGDAKTRFDCDYTRGIFAGIPTLFGLPEAEVEELECQVLAEKYGSRQWPDAPPQGGSACVYRISWETNKIPFFRRIFQKRFNQKKAIEELVQANQLIHSKYDEIKFLFQALEKKNRQLQESDNKFRILEENINDSIWIMDLATLKITYSSPSIIRNRGFTPEEIKAIDLKEGISPESYDRVTKDLAEELDRDGSPGVDPYRTRIIELQETVKGGGFTWSEASVCFLRDSNGNPTQIMGVSRYIDERKKAEEKIALSEKKYRSLFENSSDLLCIHDLNGVLIDTNLHCKPQYGLEREDLFGKNIRNLLPEKKHRKFDEYLKKILAHGSDEGLFTSLTRSGEKVILEYRNQLLFDEKGNPVSVHGAARDTTQQFMAQRALEESEEKYRRLVRLAPAGIYEFDYEKLKFTDINDVLCEISGYTRDEFLLQGPSDLITEKSQKTLEKTFEAVFTVHPEELSTEYELKTKNGNTVPVISNARFFYENGKPVRAMAVVHDLTEIRKAEEERRKLENRLQQAHKMEAIGTLAGGIAHDFNNILAGMLGYCDLINNHRHDPEKVQKQVEKVRQGVHRAAGLAQQILDFSRKTEYRKEKIFPADIFKEALKLLRSTLPATIVIREEIHCQKQILGDPGKIHQVLMNLCTNAYHAMQDTGGEIFINAEDISLSRTEAASLSLPPGSYIRLCIQDTGHGIAPEILNKIFDPYFTTKAVGKGTGMGLSIVYTIIREHAGIIQVKSSPGKGAHFSIFLPTISSPPAGIRIKAQPDPVTASGKGERIMVVDDELTILESTRELLEDFGYRADAFRDPEAALDAFDKDPERFDLVITDMTMPKMTGAALAQKIFKTNKKLPVILCTGFNESISKEQALEMGIVKFLQKPVVDRPLPDIVREVLDAAR